MHILGFCGSLRAASVNHAVLRAIEGRLPDGHVLVVHDYSDLPMYNKDLGEPEPVVALQQAIEDANALLFVTPEYNHSVPGPLKNAIDWASRPAYRSVFVGKPCGVITAAGRSGGAHCQAHLKQILLGVAAQIYPAPELTISRGADHVVDGVFEGEDDLRRIDRYMEGFLAWAARSP